MYANTPTTLTSHCFFLAYIHFLQNIPSLQVRFFRYVLHLSMFYLLIYLSIYLAIYITNIYKHISHYV